MTALLNALDERILVLDGAMGTMLQQAGLEGCHEHLNLTRPEIILGVHRAYLDAGADVIETNTFGATRIVLAEYGLAEHVFEVNDAAARLARQAAQEFSTPHRPRFVAGAMGPTTKAISVTGGATFRQIQDAYRQQAQALIEGGVDLLILETCQDTRNVKAGLLAIQSLERRVPVIVSGTIEPTGTMLAGQAVDAFWVSVAHPCAFLTTALTFSSFFSLSLRS